MKALQELIEDASRMICVTREGMVTMELRSPAAASVITINASCIDCSRKACTDAFEKALLAEIKKAAHAA